MEEFALITYCIPYKESGSLRLIASVDGAAAAVATFRAEEEGVVSRAVQIVQEFCRQGRTIYYAVLTTGPLKEDAQTIAVLYNQKEEPLEGKFGEYYNVARERGAGDMFVPFDVP
ncbi:MAG TPA: hypothetical protein VLA04_01505 [Verrucomicrobiae bacterium]|nr:hypothetical protein [Verrucomicrobiae bacterium]